MNFSNKGLFIVSFVMLFSNAFAQTADEIIKRAEDKLRSGTSYAEMTITTIRPKWSRSMEIKSWAKGPDYSIVLVTAPAKEKGTVFLKEKKKHGIGCPQWKERLNYHHL